MKKLSFIVGVFLLISGFTYSQSCSSCRVSSKNYLQYGELDKAKETSDFCITCDKSKTDPRVWYYRGMIYESILGSKEYAKLDPNALEVAYDAYKSALKYNFLDPSLQNLDLENKPEDLGKFIAALNSDKTKYTDSEILDILTNHYPTLANLYVNKGVDEYQNKKDYAKALKSFQSSLFISTLAGRLDTAIFYYAALASQKTKQYKESNKMLDVLIKLSYGKDDKEKAGNYYLVAENYLNMGDTANYLSTLKKGIEKHQNGSTSLVVELINYYLSRNKASEALSYLDLAIKTNPENSTYWFAKGSLYDYNLKESDKAIDLYKKAIELKSDYFDPNYNLGAIYFNDGAELLNKANQIPPDKKTEYQDALKKAEDKLNMALPYLEKAHQIDPKNLPTLESLKNVYYRLKMMDKLEVVKKEIDVLKK